MGLVKIAAIYLTLGWIVICEHIVNGTGFSNNIL